MTTRIDLITNAGPQGRLAIAHPLRAHNLAKAGDPKAETVALVVRDDQTDEVIGGLYAEIFYRWLFIELLAIPENVRGEGIGSRLIGMAEAVARDKHCVGIYLDTFDFQAPAFYERHGFTRFGTLDDFPPGHQRFFLQKRLD
jgi:predicted N-acetyltransferase YhbS